MIIFKKIKWRNFLSTGNQPTEIDFLENKTSLIVGTNGSGKSTLLDALTFVLFNKSFRKITKNQIINSTNGKDCLVEIEFSVGKREYKVVRGIKPNIFEIWVDGSVQDQLSAATDQQKHLEENILKLNYKSFTQIVILGSASFIPFMQLSTANRREIVEDLLDIKIFSAMNSIIKNKIKKSSDKVKEFSLMEKMTEEKIEMQKNFIESIEKNGKQDIEKKNIKIKEIEKTIENINQDSIEKNLVIENELNPKIQEVSTSSKKLKQLSSLKGKIKEKMSITANQHKFFVDHSICPTCTQKIDEEFRQGKIKEFEDSASELTKGFDELKEAMKNEEERERKFQELSRSVSEYNSQISNNNVKVSQFNRQISDIKKEIEEIFYAIENRNKEKEELENLKESLEKIKQKKAKQKELMTYFDFANLMLKDGGIKSKIIKKYLPLMNKQINKYLQLMDFYINFTLDEEFKEKIKNPIQEDFTYDSFSEGEKMRINLAILFTWREIARMKNSVNTNLLILDEVFDSSLDFNGTDYFTKIIKYVIKDSNIFVISHKTDELIDKFDRVVRFEKIKGFSKMSS
jgi:DNA repair exonuclease SbcCD ATPase subunit